MDAFQRNKFNESSFIKFVLSNSTIVSYGFISAIDFSTVTVTLAVSDKNSAEKVNCVFMSLGNEHFALSLKPVLNMRVIVFSPNKSAAGMYDTFTEMNAKQGRNYIYTGSPAVFSSQNAICVPVQKANTSALTTLIVDDLTLTADVKQDMLATLRATLELDLMGDTNIELHEGTSHFRGCYGDMEQTFGVVEGESGAEKPGTYVFKETYGRYSSVKKNYESGLDVVVGKTFEKPFLDNKGAAVDSTAPVSLKLGANAPVTLDSSAAITLNMKDNIPLTLNFGGSAVKIKADSAGGLDISITGSAPVKIVAGTGLVKLGNNLGTLKAVLDQIADLFTNMTTVGPNVVPAAPYTAAATPATALLATNLKALIDSIFN